MYSLIIHHPTHLDCVSPILTVSYMIIPQIIIPGEFNHMGRIGGGGGGGRHGLHHSKNTINHRTSTMSNITISNATDPIDFAFPLLQRLANASSFAREGESCPSA